MELQTIFSSNIPVECHILRGRLEAEGIKCFIFDEQLARIHPFRALAIGGVKLKVPSSQAELAQQIIRLISHGKLIDEQGEYEMAPVYEYEIAELTVLEPNTRDYHVQNETRISACCPNCKSENICHGYAIDYKLDLLYLLLSALFIPLPLIRKKHHCFDCGFNFKRKSISLLG